MRRDVADLGQLGIELRNHVAHDAGHGGIVKHVEELERVVDSPDEVAATARTMRLPLALKIVSSDILHKTELGGVQLAITPPEDAAVEAGQTGSAALRERVWTYG